MAKAESDLRSMITQGKDPRELPWYKTDLEEVYQPAKTILENYSKIQPDQVLQHVKDVHGSHNFSSISILIHIQFPYPCIGAFRFLDMSIPQSPAYPEILERLKSGQKLLDVGCAVGQELRHLVYDGVPSENIYASDLRQDFFDIGYDLFADRSTLKSQFIISDIFDDNSELVKQLSNGVDIINAASFFHLFTWDQQITVAKRVVSLLRAQPGSLLVGRQVGRLDPTDPDDKSLSQEHYRHSVDTWKRLWKQVGDETGTEWEVDAWMVEWAGADRIMKDFHGGMETYKMLFIVRRA
ncbi:hypothetical protein N7493_003174 [Penicillium malachiteum]|uniref:Methyltransferase domain-containing protein n=1 Tax=Penicillium malachiteum TaxID=1324776 RepID=A0AAD6HTU8_9EURO|nr:hypothetical protein N7493_003174 [Penicillium malachiteum]